MTNRRSNRVDRRSRKTRRELKQAFLKLLDRQPLNKITVAELTNMSDMGRGTFYTHYHDMFDLYEDVLNDLWDDFFQVYAETYPKNPDEDSTAFVVSLLDTIQQHQFALHVLVKQQNNGLSFLLQVSQRVAMVIIESNSLNANQPIVQASIQQVVSGVVGLITKWLLDPDSVSPLTLKTAIVFNIDTMRKNQQKLQNG